MPRCVKTAHVFDKKWRSDDVRLQEDASFSSLLLPEKILLGLQNAGYKIPSPIQLESIPVGRFGRDLLVQAKSGTGKTLVFTVIALESLSEIKYPQVLILAPTREIAIQICDVVRAVGSSFKGLTCNCFIGGLPIDNDTEKIHGCQIVVGTPGRLKHLISLGMLPTNSIRLLVMDEADVLLESNFKDDIDYIFVSLPKEKQVIATSATYPKELKRLTRLYFRKVFLARINRNDLSLLGMVHYIHVLELSKMSLLAYKAKLAALEKVLTAVQFTQCLVFCNMISRVEALCYDIRNWGFTSTYISSAKEQCDRIKAIECLKRFKCKILVTSDVTSRGIDAENVDLVINFDKPVNTETYFHRCGRAGRFGSKGIAITFIEKKEISSFEHLKLNHGLKAYTLPDPIPTNLINIRPADYDSNDSSVEEEDLSDDEIDSNKQNNHSSESPLTETSKDNYSNGSKSCAEFSSNDTNNATNQLVNSDNVNGNDLNHCGENKPNESNFSDNTLKSPTVDVLEFTENSFSSPDKISVESSNNNNLAYGESSAINRLTEEKNIFLEYIEKKSNGIESDDFPSKTKYAVLDNVPVNSSMLQVLNVEIDTLETNAMVVQRSNQNSSETQLSNKDNVAADDKPTSQALSNCNSKDLESDDFPSIAKYTVLNNVPVNSSTPQILNVEIDTLETNAMVVQRSNQNSSETQLSNKDTVAADDKSTSQALSDCNSKDLDKKEDIEIFPKPLNNSKSFTNDQAENIISTAVASNNLETDGVSVKGSDRTKSEQILNDLQISIVEYLIEQEKILDETGLISEKRQGETSNENDSKLDLPETLKSIQLDVANFYSEVYKAYQTENLSPSAVEKVKTNLLSRQMGCSASNKNELKFIQGIMLDNEVPEEKTSVKSGDNSILKCSSDSSVSYKSLSSEKKNGPEKSKDNLVNDDSLSDSDSSSHENSYLNLKRGFDAMQKVQKSKPKTSPHSLQNIENTTTADLTNNKLPYEKKIETVSGNSSSESTESSAVSEDDTNSINGELYGVKKKAFKNQKPYYSKKQGCYGSNVSENIKISNTREKPRRGRKKDNSSNKASHKIRSVQLDSIKVTDQKSKSKRRFSHNSVELNTPFIHDSSAAIHSSHNFSGIPDSDGVKVVNGRSERAEMPNYCENIQPMPQCYEYYRQHDRYAGQNKAFNSVNPYCCNRQTRNYSSSFHCTCCPMPRYSCNHSRTPIARNQCDNPNRFCLNCNWYQMYERQYRFIQSSITH